jgi:NADH-quinone oxidoreductase subunit K
MTLEVSHHSPDLYLILAAFLFAAGIFGMVRRRTLIGMLIAGELIFSAASLNLVALNHFFAADPTTGQADPTVGQVFALFILALAAAEASIALAITIAVYRNYRSINSRELSELNG